MTEKNPYKIRVVGVGGVGKSALTIQFIKGEFVEEYVPTIEESYLKDIVIDSEKKYLDILDTAGQEEYSALRDTYMRGGEGFVLVYSIVESSSLEELEEFYQQILMVKNTENVPMVLCGNKGDLVDEREIERSDGMQQSNAWSIPFFETSAKTKKNVNEAFIALCKEIERSRFDEAEKPKVDPDPQPVQKCCTII